METETYTFEDVFADSQVEFEFPGLMTIVNEPQEDHSHVGSVFFPGCSFLNYGMPLMKAVYDTLMQAKEVDGISFLCCGKILSYEPDGETVRVSFENQLMDRIAETGCKRLVCACPNCVKALRDAFARDERMNDVVIDVLPAVLSKLGYRVQQETAQQMFARKVAEDAWYRGELADDAAFNKMIAEAPAAKFSVHDSCPDRHVGEFADATREIMPEGSWVDPAHCRNKSVCCGSLPRAAGKIEQADKCALLNGTEAKEAGANAIVTPCVSCCFQLFMAQHEVPVFHYLELLYGWAIDWRTTDGLMKLRFLFDETLGAIDTRTHRKWQQLNVPTTPPAVPPPVPPARRR